MEAYYTGVGASDMLGHNITLDSKLFQGYYEQALHFYRN